MGEFAEAYQKCEDDFEVINECQCFPEEGNYTYLKNKLKSPFYNNGE